MKHAERIALLTFLMLLIVPHSAIHADDDGSLIKGLVAYWPLDGSAAEEVSGSPLNPKQVRTNFADGIAGKSLQSREGSDFHAGLHLRSADLEDLSKLQAFTLSTWYRIDALGGSGEKSACRHSAGALGWYNPDDHSQFYFTTRYKIRGNESARLTSLPAKIGATQGFWQHVVQQVDANGNHRVWHASSDSSGHGDVPVASDQLDEFDRLALTDGLAEKDSMFLAFYETKGDGSAGRVSADEIAIWDRALAPEEIKRLFLLGRAGHAVTATIPLEELQPPAVTGPVAAPRDFGWLSPWQTLDGQNPDNAKLQVQVKSTGQMAIDATGLIIIERRFPGVSSGILKAEFRVRPKDVSIEVNNPTASVMKTYLWDSRKSGSWTMRWHFPWAWPAIGGNTVPRFYVVDGGGGKRKGLEYTDILIQSNKWYTVASVLDCDNHTWEFWVDGQKFDPHFNVGRSQMKWWKTSAQEVDTIRVSTWGTNWIDAFRIYHNDELIASTDFTAQEGYVTGRSIFDFHE